MFQTAYGALFHSLRLQTGERLLIRGGTTSVGLAAAGLAKNNGSFVTSTSRRADREALLKENGADEVIVDTGAIADVVKNGGKRSFDKVLELVGTVTLRDSLQCVKEGGVVCIAGIVGNAWEIENFSPMGYIPSVRPPFIYLALLLISNSRKAVLLTTYSGGPERFMATPLSSLVAQIEAGKLRVPIGKTFQLDQIVEAHQCMDDNAAGGKIVVLT